MRRARAAAAGLRALAARSAATAAFDAHAARILAREPAVRAFTEDAETVAARARGASGDLLIAVKDNLRVDGLPPARCGAALPPESHAINKGPEATAVARLRAAGAAVAGTTRMARRGASTDSFRFDVHVPWRRVAATPRVPRG